MNAPLQRWAAQLSATILAAVTAAIADNWAVGTVVAVTPGAGTNDTDLVTVDWRGTQAAVAHLESYAPTVGHVVLMARPGPQLVIVGRIIGGPRSA